ncbi:MAG: protein translocase subunit SecD [Lysobacteraceae bacterium]
MLEFARWKYALMAVLIAVSGLYALPNVFPQDPAVQVTAGRNGEIDGALVERVRGALESAQLSFRSVAIEQGAVLVRLDSVDAQSKVAKVVEDAVGDDFVVALNLASTVPAWLEAIGGRSMVLGLDLQGGVHFLMEVDEQAAIEKRLDGMVDDIRALLREKSLHYTAVNRVGETVDISLRDATERDAAAAAVQAAMPGMSMANDASSANKLSASLKPEQRVALLDGALEQNMVTLRNRINELGVAEPIVQRQGSTRIVVQLPGVQDTARAKKIIGATATLEYRAVAEGDAFAARDTGRVPPDARLYYRRDKGVDGRPVPVLLKKSVIASGDQLTGATSGMDAQSGTPKVDVTLNPMGGQRMFEFTRDNVGKGMAVVFVERTPETRVVDGETVQTSRTVEEVISVATVQGVFGRQFQTTGLDSPEEAAQLALLLRAGSLAAPMQIAEERIIGPSLGAENIRAGVNAVAYSFIFVLVFFVVYYKMFGVITNLALFINLLMVVAVMSIIGATLTLPGLAGIALTVGMSVDANVLINERIREELRAGNTPLTSIANGYTKAAGTIADANITAVLAGIALFVFGTGPVKGFAVTLIVGILTSMYSAVSASRGIASLIYGSRRKLSGLSI